MVKRNWVLLAGFALVAAVPTVALAGSVVNGPMSFDPIPGSSYGQTTTAWTEPFIIPDGYTQTLISDEGDLDIYVGQQDLHDMNTVNETGRQAGRYLYRTHEVDNLGAVSVVDLWGFARLGSWSRRVTRRSRRSRLQPTSTAFVGHRGAPFFSPRRSSRNPSSGLRTRAASTR